MSSDETFPEKYIVRLKTSIAVAILVVLTASLSRAQEIRRIADQPVLIMRNSKINLKSSMEYFRSLSDEYQIGSNVIAMINQEGLQEQLTQREHPASGMMVYLVAGFVPEAVTITFSEVLDEAEFRRLAKLQGATTDGSLNEQEGMFTITHSSTWREDITDRQL
ncbi:MAG: hypothetical protein KDA85_15670, partial [Planctomycetaceae bacterium]|nr:hypothetical protein [Planctomycetaceae bacterium]